MKSNYKECTACSGVDYPDIPCELCGGSGIQVMCRICQGLTGTHEEICESCQKEVEQIDDYEHRKTHR